jgi:hypothetical protein
MDDGGTSRRDLFRLGGLTAGMSTLTALSFAPERALAEVRAFKLDP